MNINKKMGEARTESRGRFDYQKNYPNLYKGYYKEPSLQIKDINNPNIKNLVSKTISKKVNNMIQPINDYTNNLGKRISSIVNIVGELKMKYMQCKSEFKKTKEILEDSRKSCEGLKKSNDVLIAQLSQERAKHVQLKPIFKRDTNIADTVDWISNKSTISSLGKLLV